MTAPDQLVIEERALAEHLVRTVCERASGRSAADCIRNYPRDLYFIGNLRPRDDAPPDADQPPHFEELRSKLAPVAFGAEFLLNVPVGVARLDVEVEWTCYYRVFPTIEQQRAHQSSYVPDPESGSDQTQAQPQQSDDRAAQDELAASTLRPLPAAGDSDDEDEDTEAPTAVAPESDGTHHDRQRDRAPKDSLFIRFRKVACQASGVVALRVERGVPIVDVTSVQDAVDQEMSRAHGVVRADPERIRLMDPTSLRIQVPDDALRSEAAYTAFVRRHIVEVAPHWGIDATGEARPDERAPGSDLVVRVEFVNASAKQLDTTGRDNPNIEPFLFDVGARVAIVEGNLLPFDLDLAPRGFRYDRRLWGRGFNCAVELRGQQPPSLQTTHTPVYWQGRNATRLQPTAAFAALAEDPLPTLEKIQTSMREYLEVWGEADAEYFGRGGAWTTAHQAEFARDRKRFEREIERFAAGVRLVASDPDVRLAFQLTNEAFQRAGANDDPAKRKESWRLFQIVFLVSQLPGIWALAHPESPEATDRRTVDIIYFPTGGGKTEAYLATTVFHCFFDRLRGKTCGTTVWTRFPLRLLTLQQTQRVADVLGMAELVRRGHSDRRLSGPAAAEFAVGYFVGKEGTPNELVDPANYRYANEEHRVTWSMANDAQVRQAWKRVTRCPACKTNSVQLDLDSTRVCLIHRCTNTGCMFPRGHIPCYIVDNEIYRYLPAVIVGTIDKLAGLGNQRKFAQVFGQVDGRCSVHGFYKGKCPQKDCADRSRLQPGVPPGITGPTLFVQDELHLLKEGLGTFDSHYESFVQRLRREFGQSDDLKIIASSATIEAFERQVVHVYGRDVADAIVFPGPGPRLSESFYAQITSQAQRVYVGILPHNKTIFNAILELFEYYHFESQRLVALAAGVESPFGSRSAPGSPEWSALLDSYVTSLTYFLAGRDLNSIRTDIVGDVNPSLFAAGQRPVELHEMTGDTTSDEVTRVLTALETPRLGALAPTGVLATSMISHGVDVDRLNAMIFFGMPRQTAEYIQASSRVGRSHVGIVLTCLHPIRERDQSHYTYFSKYHEFLGQLVEPVAVNRWAKFSVQRTLPGLFMGVLLQVLANRAGGREIDKYYLLDYVQQRIADGSVRAELFYPILEESYLIPGADPVASEVFRDEIRLRVPQFLDQILSAGPESRFVSEVLIPAPMRSLRDVDEAVPIELDSTGSRWAGR